MVPEIPNGQPGERWVVKLQPIDAVSHEAREAIVKLVDFDPRTQAWTVEEEGVNGSSLALAAECLLRKL